MPLAVVLVCRLVDWWTRLGAAHPHRLVVVEAVRSVVLPAALFVVSALSVGLSAIAAGLAAEVGWQPVVFAAGLAGEADWEAVYYRAAPTTPPVGSKLAEQVRSFAADLLAVR